MEGGNYADSFVQLGKVSANKWQNFSVCVIAEPPQIEFNPTQCPYWPSFFRYQCFWGVVVCHKNWNWGRILSSFQVCTCSRRSWIREGKVEQLGHSSICNVYHLKHKACNLLHSKSKGEQSLQQFHNSQHPAHVLLTYEKQWHNCLCWNSYQLGLPHDLLKNLTQVPIAPPL